MDSFSETQRFTYLPQIGHTWQNYQIIREIARGGMGIVYEAVQLAPQRQVAIKVIQASNIGVHMKRFEREIEITANLSHPNIANIYVVEKHPQFVALIMEYIDGAPLTTYFQDNEISLPSKLKIFIDACKALKYAHDNKIIHRDIKPGNIMVTKNGEVKLIDFGIAKQVNQKFDLTKTGQIIGTPKYMAPEQITGSRKGIDHQSDIYAMGAVLYELITSKEMIEGDVVFEIFFNISYQKIVPPRQLNEQIDRNLEKIWRRTIAHTKKERYRNVGSLINDLENYLVGKPISRSFFKRTSRKVIVAILIGIISWVFYYKNFYENTPIFELGLSIKEQEILKSKDYEQVIREYKKYPEIQNNRLLQKHIMDSYFKYREAGIEYFNTGNMKRARAVFEIFLEKFPSDLEVKGCLAKTYLPQGEYYAEKYPFTYQENLEKTKKILSECVEVDPYNAEHFFLMGKISYSLEKYDDAFKNFQYCLELNDKNLEALEILCKIPYDEPFLQEECYSYLIDIFADFNKYKKINLFEVELQSQEKQYLNDYLYYIGLVEESDSLQEMPDLDKVIKNQHLENVLLRFRYQKNFGRNLQKLATNQSNKQYIAEILEKAQLLRKQEYHNYSCYLLAYMFNHQNWQHPQLKHEENKARLKQEIRENLTFAEENCFIIFFSIHAYIKLFGFSDFLNPQQNAKFPYRTQVILTTILREMNIPLLAEVYKEYFKIECSTEKEQDFLQYLISETIYIYHESFYVDTFGRRVENGKVHVSEHDILLLEKIMENQSEKVQISALMALFHLKSISISAQDTKGIDDLIQKIKTSLQDENVLIRSYIHNRFWLNQYIISHIQDYKELYFSGLQDKDENVRQATILFNNAVLYTLKEKDDEVIKVLEHILTNEKVKVIGYYALATYIRISNPDYAKLKNDLDVFQCNDFAKLYGNIFFLHRKIVDLQNLFTGIKQVRMYRSDVKSSGNIYTKLFTSHYFSFLGSHDIDVAAEEKSIPNLLCNLHYEANIKLSNSFNLDIVNVFSQRVDRETRLLFAKKYLDNAEVRKYVIPSYIALQENEEEREKVFQKYKNEKAIMKIVALGYYLSLKREVKMGVAVSVSDLMHVRPKHNYFIYIENLIYFLDKKFIKNTNKINVYESWLQKAISLTPENSKYLFELGVIHRVKNNLREAISFISQAIEKEQENYLYYYHRAQAFIFLNKKQEAIADLQKTVLLMPDDLILMKTAFLYRELREYEKAENVYNRMFTQGSFDSLTKYLGLIENYLDLEKKEEAMNLLYCLSELYKRKEYKYNARRNINYISKEVLEKDIIQYPKTQAVLDEFYEKYYK